MNYTKTDDKLEDIKQNILLAAEAFGKTRADVVFGEGDTSAKVMLIGEAPGAEETRLSRPFVGQAGKNLDEFLRVLGLSREEIYITNVVKFRPYKVSTKGTLSNRPPKAAETAGMLPCLLREIEAVAPKVVVTLGNVPLRCIAGKSAVIGGCHASALFASALSHEFTLFPLYHPASIIYNRSLKDVYAEDLIKLKVYINSI